MKTLIALEMKKMLKNAKFWILLCVVIAVTIASLEYRRRELESVQINRYEQLQQHRTEFGASSVSLQQLAKAKAGMAEQLTYEIPEACAILQKLEDMTFRQAFTCRTNNYEWSMDEMEAHRTRLQTLLDCVLDRSLEVRHLPWDYQDIGAVQNEIKLMEYCMEHDLTPDQLHRFSGWGHLCWSMQTLTSLVIIPAVFVLGVDMISKDFAKNGHILPVLFSGSRKKVIVAKLLVLLSCAFILALLVCACAFTCGCIGGAVGELTEIVRWTDDSEEALLPLEYGSYSAWSTPARYVSVGTALISNAFVESVGIVFACSLVLALNLLTGSLEATLGLSAGIWFALAYLQGSIQSIRHAWNPVALLSMDGMAQGNILGSIFLLLGYCAVINLLALVIWEGKAL